MQAVSLSPPRFSSCCVNGACVDWVNGGILSTAPQILQEMIASIKVHCPSVLDDTEPLWKTRSVGPWNVVVEFAMGRKN